MHWLFQFVLKHRVFFSLFVVIVVSFFTMSQPPKKQDSLSRALTMTLFFPFEYVSSEFLKARTIFSDNRKLKKENVSLKLQLSKVVGASRECDRLRNMLNLKSDYKYSLLAVKTLISAPTYNLRSVVIDCGSKDGVKKFMPVINSNGVLGKIISVMPSISLVQLIKEPSERVGVKLQSNDVSGILETVDGNSFFVRYREHVVVDIGDTLVSSGLGGIYPPNLSVGIVSKIVKDADPLFKKVYIKTTVDFEHINEAFVVLLEPRWSAFRNQLDSLESGDEYEN